MATITRQDLEKMAMEKVSSVNHYELADNLDEVSDGELWGIIYGYEEQQEKAYKLKESVESEELEQVIDILISMMQNHHLVATS